MSTKHLTIPINELSEKVSGLLLLPDQASVLLVLAHGAGAPMDHKDMTAYAEALASQDIATLRYNFPFTEKGKKRPDRPEVARATIRAAVSFAQTHYPELRTFAGGKSFGGRMTSHCAAEKSIEVEGLVFYGFPLHAPGKPSTDRAGHLRDVSVPMLFLQGNRDALAKQDLIKSVCEPLPNAELMVIEEGDHSLHVTKRSGRTFEEVLQGVSIKIREWMSD